MPSHLNFKPRIDGFIVPDLPEILLSQGEYHKVPLMTGVLQDEWARSMGFFYKDLDHTSLGRCSKGSDLQGL